MSEKDYTSKKERKIITYNYLLPHLQVTYPDEQLHFEDRITFRHNVQDRQMEVVLWELAVDDSGKLILSANYGNNLVTVKSETSLRVEDKGKI